MIIFVGIGAFFLGSKFTSQNQTLNTTVIKKVDSVSTSTPKNEVTDVQTFKFSSFHGKDLNGVGFQFNYPSSWNNDGQYFSPQKITHYDINSVDAPVYYDLISESLVDTSDLKYQITKDKRYSPDSSIVIDGISFRKYDLLDYQDTERNRVIIYVGPKINIFGESYILVFHFEEKPLGLTVTGNDVRVFDQMVESIRFK